MMHRRRRMDWVSQVGVSWNIWMVTVAIMFVEMLSTQSNANAIMPPLPQRALVFRLLRTGISPTSITAAPGTYRVRLINQFVRAPLTVTVVNPASQSLSTKAMPRATFMTEDTVTFVTPGQHKITIAENPAWTATITVEPQ